MKATTNVRTVFITIIVLLATFALVAKADYVGVVTEDLNLRNSNGRKVAVIHEGELVKVKEPKKGQEEQLKKRVFVKWHGQEGTVRKNKVKKVIPAITTKELNQRDEEYAIVQCIPEGSIVFLKEELTEEKERILVEYNGKVGTILSNGIEKDFIIISIEEQKLTMYKNNLIVCEGPVVTGTATDPERATPTGTFSIRWKERERYLKGPGYKSYVHYWMPINGGIGIHDADGWRSEYGGDIYMYAGSHGCINIPLKLAKKVYQKVYVGMTVVVK